MDLSIVIVNWNTYKLLDQCLNSLDGTQSMIKKEIIVVDNGSTDDSVKMVELKHPDVMLIKNDENVGFSKANNQGFRMSHGRYVMFLNTDTIVLGDALSKIVEFLDTNPEAGIVGPKVLNPDGSLQVSAAKSPTLMNTIVDLFKFGIIPRFSSWYASYDNTMEVGWVSGACLTARCETIEQLGGWDESLFMYSEDVDLCMRAHDMGWGIFFYPRAEIIHLRGQSIGQLDKRRVLQVHKSVAYLRRRYFSPVAYSIYLLFATLAMAAKIVYFLCRLVASYLSKDTSMRVTYRQKLSAYWLVLKYYLHQSIKMVRSRE